MFCTKWIIILFLTWVSIQNSRLNLCMGREIFNVYYYPKNRF